MKIDELNQIELDLVRMRQYFDEILDKNASYHPDLYRRVYALRDCVTAVDSVLVKYLDGTNED